MKTILITGASRGIGFATTKKFLAEGCKVIGTYLHTPINIQHENLIALQYDQSDPASIEKFANKVKELTSHLDILVNNAGILLDSTDQVADPAKVRRTLEVNVVGVIDLTEKLLPLLGSGSKIINLNSGYGVISEPILDDATAAGYRISKAALNMYTRHLAFRLEQKGVIVIAFAPGWVSTDMGNIIATETDKPDRTPEQAADDLYYVATHATKTNEFWRMQGKSDW